MSDPEMTRHYPLDGRAIEGAVAMRALDPAARWSLRVRPADIAAANAALGIELPTQPCRAAVVKEIAALWLGPDEWLLLAPVGTDLLALAPIGISRSLVDIGERQTGFTIEGEAAADVLNAACPLDLHPTAFPVGMCTRTVFAKAEIVLWRSAPATFRVEVWRSFADYVWRLIALSAIEAGGSPCG